MEIRKQKHIPLACRYIPYDQWFLTHVDPTWKIKHFKQSILAKCFGLPFDPRRITKDVPGVRPPSPITFAPDEGQRPISPIKFANPQELRKKRSAGGHPEEDGSSNNQQEDAEEGGGGEEGYEEDDEWEDDDDFDDLEPPPMFASTKPVGLGLTTSGRVDVPMPVAPPLGVGPVPVAGGKKKRRFNPLAKISTAGKSASNATSTPSNHPDALQDQIQCQWFTLIRFSTGQILEDDYLVSWYDLAAYELVELHSSSPPVSFAISASLGQLLLHGTINADANILNQGNNPSQVKSGIINTSASVTSALSNALTLSLSANHALQTSNMTSTPLCLTPLPRYDPAAYVQPYWEGWVRALRVVWRSSASGVGTDPTPGGRGKYEFPEYPAGMATMGGGGSGMAMWESAMYMDGDGKGVDGRYPRLHLQGKAGGVGEGERRSGRERDSHGRERTKTKLEWRERWVVIRDGVISLFKERDDPIPTHRLPLSALINLRGAEHLAQSVHSKSSHTGSTSGRTRSKGSSRTGEHDRDRQPRRSTSVPRTSTSTAREVLKKETLARPKTVVDIEEVPPHNAHADGEKDMTAAHRRRPAANASVGALVDASLRRSLTQVESGERQRIRERELQREKEREKERERRRIREKQEKEVEYLRRWDDIGLSFPFGGKGKEKEKAGDKRRGGDSWDKHREKEKERSKKDKESSKDKEQAGDNLSSKRHDAVDKEKERQRERERERAREREKEKERERQKERREREKEKEKEKARLNDRTYIPYSREEAEAAGMKIICAKFQSTRIWEREKKERERQKPAVEPANQTPKYTSTGPSLAGEIVAGYVLVDSDPHETLGGGGGWKDVHGQPPMQKSVTLEENLERQHHHGHGHTQSIAPRKASLPGLGLGLGKLGTTPSVSMSSLATSGTASSQGRPEHPAAAGSSGGAGGGKFAIVGLFAKDKEATDDAAARKDKDDKKREEKERKARDKELKQLGKEKKGKERMDRRKEGDGDEDEVGVGSGLSWKLNKKLPSRPATATHVPSGSSVTAETISRLEDMQSSISLSTADTTTLQGGEDTAANASIASTSSRPKLTLSPTITAPNTITTAVAGAADGERSDSDSSSLSLSSPVFAHSTESDQSFDEDDLSLGIYGKDRKGYRYGGYHPPAGKLQSRTTQGPSNVELDGNKSESSRSYLMMINKTGLEDPESSRTETERVRTLDKGKGRASEREHLPPLAPERPPQKLYEKEKRKEDDRGEWLVLDMGTEHAFTSILRIFHREFSAPLTSTFIPSSITDAPSSELSQAISNKNAQLTTTSSSPIRRTFWSSSAHGHGADDESLNDERSLIGGASSSSHANAIAPTAGSDADDDIDDIYADSAMVPASHQNRSHQAQKSKTIHPQVLASLTLNPAHPNTPLAPALPYPEWRIELVLRARLYGMHEAGRPLELAMYGWGRDFVEMEKASVSYRKRRRKEEAGRRRVRTSLFGGPTLDESVSLSMGKSRWIDDDAQQSTEGSGEADRDEIAAEDRGRERNWDGVESARRMSQVSHVSTIKATVMNIAGATHRTPIQPTDEEDDAESTAHELGETQTERSLEDSGEGGVDGFQDDKYEAGYAYGQDDEEDALFEGLGSVMEDSEEESETEWLAWPTDLSRQVIVRQQKMELDRIQQQRAREDELRDRLDHDQPPLSPMVFLNPFPGTDTASFISQNVGLPSVLPPVPPPKTPEEERRQYAEKKRKLEPSAVSTSLLSPLPSPALSPGVTPTNPASTHHHTPSASGLQAHLHAHARTPSRTLSHGQHGYHGQHFPSRTSTLSSPSSSESLRCQSLARVGAGVTNSYSNPISPLAGFSPIDDEDLEAELDAPTSSTMPPSATGHSYTRQVHQRSHSRSISGSSPGSILAPFKTAHMQSISKSQAQVIEDEQSDLSSSWPTRGSTLHHSMSMPLAGCGYPDATPLPQSPSRMSTAKILPQPISMPILTQAQISQIESETEEMMLRAMSNPPSPSTSPSSFGHSSMRDPAPASFMTIPRRSGSTGVVPGSPPSAGSGGSVGRSASVLVKPSPSSSETGGNERGMLRKKRSDTVTTAGGGDKMETEQSPQPNTRPRPSLSLQSLSGSRGRTVEVQSPTQQRHALRSPTTAHPHSHTGNHGSTAVSVSGGASTMASAKAILRRVRSGSSLGMDMRIEEVSPHAEESQASWRPNSPAASTSAAGNGSLGRSGSRLREASPPPSKKKKGAMDRIVRGLDSALEFVEGR